MAGKVVDTYMSAVARNGEANHSSGVMAPTSLISVCIPVYCGEEHIAETIRSVLAQTLGDFELVIIDNASPDGTARVIATFDDPRIRYVRNPTNLGPEDNYSKCLSEARGKYFKLVPHDDLLHPDCLRRQVEILDGDTAGDIALVFCARRIINGAGLPQMVRGYPGKRAGRISAASVIRQCVRHGTNLIGEPAGVMMRRALAESVG